MQNLCAGGLLYIFLYRNKRERAIMWLRLWALWVLGVLGMLWVLWALWGCCGCCGDDV